MPKDIWEGVAPNPWTTIETTAPQEVTGVVRKPGIRVAGYIPWDAPLDYSQYTERYQPRGGARKGGTTFIWIPSPEGAFTDDMFEQEPAPAKVNLSDYLNMQSAIGPYPSNNGYGDSAEYIPNYLLDYYT